MEKQPPNSDAEPASSVSKKRQKYHQLFRTDLISAMKLPNNKKLDESEFWEIRDPWTPNWEKPVQVPVNSELATYPEARCIREKKKSPAFKLPKKLIRTTKDSFFSKKHHVLTDVGKKAESICKYDLDDLDCHWLALFNERREDFGLSRLSKEMLEVLLEDFETQCSKQNQDSLKSERGLDIIEYDDVICDVCRSPQIEEENMVFCDSCKISVHQTCYGITAIPVGSWICRPCAFNIKPPCMLCPNKGGAMKITSENKWAHVSCALWIPEVVIRNKSMKPITKISEVPARRWALICALCRKRNGACIQCSEKQCKIAYHVTCALKHGLKMEMSNKEGVKMQSYCVKHSKTDASARNIAESSRKSSHNQREIKSPNEMDEHNARLQKIRFLEAHFHQFINIKYTAEVNNLDLDVVQHVYYYWVMKRKTKLNKALRPLLIPECYETNLPINQHENLLQSRIQMFIHIRQDLEKVRNLCCMVKRREKLFCSYVRVKNEISEKQVEILRDESLKLTTDEIKEVHRAQHGDAYDAFYCVVSEEEKKEANNKSTVQNQEYNPHAYVNVTRQRNIPRRR